MRLQGRTLFVLVLALLTCCSSREETIALHEDGLKQKIFDKTWAGLHQTDTHAFVVVTAVNEGTHVVDDEQYMAIFLQLDQAPRGLATAAPRGWVSVAGQFQKKGRLKLIDGGSARILVSNGQAALEGRLSLMDLVAGSGSGPTTDGVESVLHLTSVVLKAASASQIAKVLPDDPFFSGVEEWKLKLAGPVKATTETER